MRKSIDLNADVGEGLATDRELLALVSSANISCGFHAGDERITRSTIEEALQQGVAIGAHPGYPDPDAFGRRETGATPDEISRLIATQLESFAEACDAAGATISFVKPHGALYNRAAKDRPCAVAIAEAVLAFDATLTVLGPPGSAMLDEAVACGLSTANEGFLDRAYEADGALVARDREGATILDEQAAADRAGQIILRGTVTAITGVEIPLPADSLCVHGDSAGALAIARAVRERLGRLGVSTKPFTRS